jgi:Holliday junction resolvase RusA-like endonuclease
MGHELTVTVAGKPAPQGSKARGRNGGLYDMSKGLESWRRAIAVTVRAALSNPHSATWPSEAAAGPVAATVIFLMTRPQDHYRTGQFEGLVKDSAPLHPATRPDVDKLARAVLDALKMSGAIKDDGQVVSLAAVKTYGAAGSTGARIHLEAL